MAGGFQYRPQGEQAIVARFREIDRKLAALRRTITNPLISNESLRSPVVPAVATDSNTGLNATAGFVTIVEVHLDVPSGFTTALVTAVGSSGASCEAAGGTFVSAGVLLANHPGHVRSQWVPAAFGGGTGCSFAQVLTDLQDGGDVGVAVLAQQSSPSNVIAGSVGGDLSVSVVFLR